MVARRRSPAGRAGRRKPSRPVWPAVFRCAARRMDILGLSISPGGMQTHPAGRLSGSATRRLRRQAPSDGAATGPLSPDPNKPQALDDASVPSRRGRLGTSNFGGPQSGIASSDVRKPLPIENSSSSSPIRANTRLISCNPNDAAVRTSVERKLFPINTLSSGARLPSAPARRGETERKATLAGSHSR